MRSSLHSFALLAVLTAPLSSPASAAQGGGVSVNVGLATPRSPLRAGRALSTVTPVWSQNGLGPVELDASNGGPSSGDGGPLTIGGQVFASGLGCYSTSAIAYDLGGQAFAFSSWVGIDDSAGASGSAAFQVLADGVVLFDSGVLTGADAPLFTGRLNLRGVRELILLVRDGGDGAQDDLANWADAFLSAPRFQPGDGSSARAVRGEWLPAEGWPLDPIQAAVLGTGELLTFSSEVPDGPGSLPISDPHSSTTADLYDPVTGVHLSVDHPTAEVYGAGLARSSDGELLAVGGYGGRTSGSAPVGADQLSRFDSSSRSWIPLTSDGVARHGAAGVTLGDGSLLALAGADSGARVTTPAIRSEAGWSRLPGVDLGSWLDVNIDFVDGLFPFAHLAPSGEVVLAGWDTNLGVFSTEGGGEWTFQGQRESTERIWGAATSVGPDLILVAGGVDRFSSTNDAERSAVTIDLSGPTPAVSSTGEMLFARADHDTVVLADGTVLATGGSRRHNVLSASTAVRVAELWDPATGEWSLCAASVAPRGYRATSVLLPDATVWTGGGVPDPGTTTNLSAEVFRPPYLFEPSGGQLATRPAIASAPGELTYGQAFQVQLSGSDPIGRVTLVRAGSATHGTNSDQRCLELAVAQTGATLDVTAPESGNLAPPGAYMLFVIDGAGVPSVASMVQLRRSSPAQWEELPSSDGSVLTCRHEAAMVTVNGRLYLMGGRGNRPSEAFDPTTGKWTTLGLPPFEINHFQPVVLDGLVYVIGAFTGSYPNETNVPNVWTWDPLADVWTQGPLIPAARQRGSNGAFARDGKIYVIGGNNQGHNGGARPWFDEYDPATQTWQVLPDAPRARDHFTTVLIGDRLVAAGGRTTQQPGPFGNTIGAVDIYDFSDGTWSTIAEDIPTRRAGTMTVPVGRFAVVIGGESTSQVDAHSECEALDVLSEEWTTLPPLVDGRHSGGIGQVDGRIYVASGSGRRGGNPELDTLEVIDGDAAVASADQNLLTNGDFSDGLTGWQTVGAALLDPEAGVAAPSVRLEDASLEATAAVAGGASVSLSALLRASGAGAASLSVEALDASQASLATATINVPLGGVLSRLEASLGLPAGTQSIRVTALSSGGTVLVVDDLVAVAQ